MFTKEMLKMIATNPSKKANSSTGQSLAANGVDSSGMVDRLVYLLLRFGECTAPTCIRLKF